MQIKEHRLAEEVPGDLQEGNMSNVVGIQMSVSKYICGSTKMGDVGTWEAGTKEEWAMYWWQDSFGNTHVVGQTGRWLGGHKS